MTGMWSVDQRVFTRERFWESAYWKRTWSFGVRTNQIAFTYGAINVRTGEPDFQDLNTLQDLPIVESQVPQRLPLEMADEFHQPCDKLSIAYWRWLKELKFSYGTLLAGGQ